MRNAAFILAAALLVGIVIAEAPPPAKPAAPVTGAGILIETPGDGILVLTDGEDTPAKYVYAESFNKASAKGIFTDSRVQMTYLNADGTRKLLTLKKDPRPATGTVTGMVCYTNDYWIAVKPK